MIDYKGQLNMGNEALQSEKTITANEVLRTCDTKALAREISHQNKPKRESKRLKYSISFQNYNNTNKKKVDQYNADGNYVATYDSISAASKATDISKWQISSVCSGRRKMAHGYIFRYSGI